MSGPIPVRACSLGAGGMGEVYRARDERARSRRGDQDPAAALRRAIRNASRASSAKRGRWPRSIIRTSARSTASKTCDGGPALVLELVEGETLADGASREQRSAAGSCSPRRARTIARQIAEALEAAHERGIVHRDLKPANIKITPRRRREGARLRPREARGGRGRRVRSRADSLADGRRARARATASILGTIAYMSPEQARGKAADKRSDVWAFGVVLLEMLTGRPVFTGETESEVLAAVLNAEPDLSMLPAATPAPIRRLLRRCLEKDRKRRLDSADRRSAGDRRRGGGSGCP